MNTTQEDQLTRELRLLTAAQPFSPDLDCIARRAQAARRRSVVVRGTAVAGAAAGVTAAVLVAVSLPAGPAARPSLTSPRPSAHAILVNTVAALSKAGRNSIERMVERGPDEIYRILDDQPDQASAVTIISHGHKAYQQMSRLEPGTKGTFVDRQVNYRNRTWSQASSAYSGPSSFPNPAAIFRQDIKPSKNGRFRIVGSSVVDGVPVYIVRVIVPRSNAADAELAMTFWISKSTYLPVKSARHDFTTRYYWSGPGSVNVGRYWPAVPAGFKKVPAPKGPTIIFTGGKKGLFIIKGTTGRR